MPNPPVTNSIPREFGPRDGDVTYASDLSGNFTFLSAEGEHISGYTCDEACRMNIADLLDPEIAGRVHEQIIREAGERIGTVHEVDLIARDGRRIPLEVSTRAVLRDGKTIEVQGVAVPSVIRGFASRCVDRDFFFGSSAPALDIVIGIA